MSLREPLYDPASFATPQADDVPAPEPTREEMDDFKQMVQKWMQTKEQLKKLNDAVRERRVHERVLCEKIQDFMIKYKYDDLSTHGTLIRSKVRQAKVPLKLTEVKEIIQTECGEDMVAKIFERERPTVEKRSLRRVQQRVALTI